MKFECYKIEKGEIDVDLQIFVDNLCLESREPIFYDNYAEYELDLYSTFIDCANDYVDLDMDINSNFFVCDHIFNEAKPLIKKYYEANKE